jgi:AcrR family transcriptional regulator
MPAPVDHESRRHQIVRIATDLIDEVGLAAVTLRQIAGAAGFSTAIVTHYFANKRELLLAIYRAAAIRAKARIDVVLACDAGDLQGAIEALLPLDAVRLCDWKVYFTFWDSALGDPVFSAEQREQVIRAATLLRKVLETRMRTGRAASTLDAATAAQRLLVIIQGVAVQSAFDPQGWPAQTQRDFLAGELEALGCRG